MGEFGQYVMVKWTSRSILPYAPLRAQASCPASSSIVMLLMQAYAQAKDRV